MLNVSQMLKSVASKQGIRLEVVQKDYALSYLLAGMAQTPGLAEQIVLKGGTALKKLYYPDYRFSEDLDFSTLKRGIIPNGDELLKAAVASMTGQLEERGPFEVQLEPLTLRLPSPRWPDGLHGAYAFSGPAPGVVPAEGRDHRG